jgi:hypothetical protein
MDETLRRGSEVVNVYDAFISYNSRDSEAVEELARRLEDEAGLLVWKDNWELAGGDDWLDRLPEAISQSRAMVVFVGPNGLGPWHKEEIKIGLQRAVKRGLIRVIPAALPGCPEDMGLPEYLDAKHYVNLRTVDAWGMHLLRCAVVEARPGRRDQFEHALASAPQGLVRSRLGIAEWSVGDDRLNYLIKCRISNSGFQDTITIHNAIARVHRQAEHPITKSLMVLRAPIRESRLGNVLEIPDESSFVRSAFRPNRYLKPKEVEDVVLPVYVKHGFRLVISFGIEWTIPGETLVRVTEAGYIALGKRGRKGDEYSLPPASMSYSPGQHNLDKVHALSRPEWPAHWPQAVSPEEWLHYGSGEKGFEDVNEEALPDSPPSH